MFADLGEDIQETGDAEEFADAFAEVDELEGAAGGPGRGVEADESAEAHAVHVGHVAEVEDELFDFGEELLDRVVELIGDAGDQPALAKDGGGGAGLLNLQREELCCGCLWHGLLLRSKDPSNARFILHILGAYNSRKALLWECVVACRSVCRAGRREPGGDA